jgi:hypothetical protein
MSHIENMRLNTAPEEAFPLPETGRPELYGIEGYGETVYDPEAAERRAAIRVVPDEALPADEVGEAEAAEVEADNGPEDAALRAQAAAKISRLLGRARGWAAATVELAVDASEDYYHKRGGGGGALWLFLKTQAEKYHDEGCGCTFCAA